MINFISLSPFLNDTIIELVKEKQCKENLLENYPFIFNPNMEYIFLEEEDLHNLQLMYFQYHRFNTLNQLYNGVYAIEVEEFDTKFRDFLIYLEQKYLKNIKYRKWYYDGSQEKIFYLKEV